MWSKLRPFWPLLLAAVGWILLGLVMLTHRPAPSRVTKEAPAPAVALPGGGMILARIPGRPPPPLPEGVKGEQIRAAHVDLEPTRPGPIGLDMQLVKAPDGSQRVVVEADGARILGGFDLPIQPKIPDVRPWAIGAGVSMGQDGRLAPAILASWTRGRFVALGGLAPVWNDGKLRPVVMVGAGFTF